MAIVPSDAVDRIVARLPNAGNTDQNNAAKGYISIIVEEILKEVTTKGVVGTTVTGTAGGDAIVGGVGVGTVS